jgi:hypothetical protein
LRTSPIICKLVDENNFIAVVGRDSKEPTVLLIKAGHAIFWKSISYDKKFGARLK